MINQLVSNPVDAQYTAFVTKMYQTTPETGTQMQPIIVAVCRDIDIRIQHEHRQRIARHNPIPIFCGIFSKLSAFKSVSLYASLCRRRPSLTARATAVLNLRPSRIF